VAIVNNYTCIECGKPVYRDDEGFPCSRYWNGTLHMGYPDICQVFCSPQCSLDDYEKRNAKKTKS